MNFNADPNFTPSPFLPAPDAPAEEPLRPTSAEAGEEVADSDDEALAGNDAAASALANWKDDLRQDFESWLASLEEIPKEDEALDDGADAPDLYSFYEQFAAANAENRKANRRTVEAFSQWAETLARFEGGLAPLRETAAQIAAAQPKAGELPRAHCLVLAELLDRMHRLARAFQTPPVERKSWWGGTDHAAWQKAWSAQRQAHEILVSHFEGLLKQAGVTRIETAGQPFDPAVMLAVTAEPDASRPPQTVLEEVAAGYRRHGELLRAAQVKVSRKP